MTDGATGAFVPVILKFSLTFGPVDQHTRDLLLAADGDDRAFRRVVASTEHNVRRFCARLGVIGFDLEEVVQETFVRAYRGLATFRASASANSWLLTIARRSCLDHFARAKRDGRVVDALQGDALWRVHQSDDQEVVHLVDLIEQLPLDFREAFVLVRICGCSYDEAASIIGCPRGTVQSRVARARQALVALVSAADAVRVSRASA